MLRGAGPDGSAVRAAQAALTALRDAETGVPQVLIGYSGGMDSHLLLHLACRVWGPARMQAVHVHHGLHARADDWSDFCTNTCTALGIGLTVKRLAPNTPTARAAQRRLGLEGWARIARHDAIGAVALQQGVPHVLLAHHLDDQIETHLLHRARGAGARGLAGMPAWRRLNRSDCWMVRPWLHLEHALLAQAAQALALCWVEDPANADDRFARTAVRRALGRRLTAHQVEQTAHATAAAAAPGELLRTRALHDLYAAHAVWQTEAQQAVADAQQVLLAPGTAASALSRSALAALPADRAAAVVRHWLEDLGRAMPPRARLMDWLRQFTTLATHQCSQRHDGGWIVAYRDRVRWLPGWPEPGAVSCVLTPGGMRDPVALHTLTAGGLHFGPGQGQDRMRLGPGRPVRDWKHHCQAAGIPTWLRPALPVLRAADGSVMFAAGLGWNEDRVPAIAQRGEPGGSGHAASVEQGESGVAMTCHWPAWLAVVQAPWQAGHPSWNPGPYN